MAEGASIRGVAAALFVVAVGALLASPAFDPSRLVIAALVVAVLALGVWAWPVLRRVRVQLPVYIGAGEEEAQPAGEAAPAELNKHTWLLAALRRRAQQGDRVIRAQEGLFREWLNSTADLLEAALDSPNGVVLRTMAHDRERALRELRSVIRKLHRTRLPAIRDDFDPRTY